MLEDIATDNALFEQLPEAERKRLKEAVYRFHNPDPAAQRQKLKGV